MQLLKASTLAVAAAAALFGSVAVAQPGFTVIPRLFGGGYTVATALSPDGQWVVGYGESALVPTGYQDWRWSASTGLLDLGLHQGSYRAQARAVSAGGSVIAGSVDVANRAYRWTAASGKELLPLLPNMLLSEATAVSADGAVIVGRAWTSSEVVSAFVWTPAGGLGSVPGVAPSRANAVSADGNVVVGYGRIGGSGPEMAFRWQAGSPGVQSLGAPPGSPNSFGEGVSADGRIVLGMAGSVGPWDAFVWTDQHGFVMLPEIGNWIYCHSYAASVDGRIVVGNCDAPGGATRAFVWTGPGPQGPYQARFLQDYLGEQRGLILPPNTNLWWVAGITGNGRVMAGYGIIQGQFHAFRAEFCYANCDNSIASPYLSIDDFMCFINSFAEAQSLPHDTQRWHYANCDGSSVEPVLNIDDFICFVNRFAEGCQSP